MAEQSGPIRILLVDDNPAFRLVFCQAVERYGAGRAEVVGQAKDGVEAIAMAYRLKPTIVAMDVLMPKMGGVEAVGAIMARSPTRILVMTHIDESAQGDIAFRAVDRGALELVSKPSRGAEFRFLIDKLMVLARAPIALVNLPSPAPQPADSPRRKRAASMPLPCHQLPAPMRRVNAVVIVSSTGGPVTVRELLGHLPSDFRPPIFLVQHLLPGFARHFVDRLAASTELPVSPMIDGLMPRRGHVYVAPDHAHVELDEKGCFRFDELRPPIGYVRPRGDLMLSAAASVYARGTVVGLVLTGLGDDGAIGLVDIKQRDGFAMAQDASSAVIDAMPSAARQTGVCDFVGPPRHLAEVLTVLTGQLGSSSPR